jgi:hypothetical protein
VLREEEEEAANGIQHKQVDQVLECIKCPDRFQVALTPLTMRDGSLMHVLHVKRTAGNSFMHKEICRRLLPQLRV